ncbi:TCR/Tet family MFS transporter [Maricaulis salignorans]|uniref:MFS transporter, DHA1 family, tetracycline resistance protein n=1 Tax=Maricaulis salignorans TaxID=144026 RepID=A0A1G9V329_9PROT|nr:TCR/Tet family MFS transporter [Maricaulis salignorans]SDM66519.1 MFS transporter, DHA1 family, tetracycline resistance protein [Maricaulis salignorans]
MSARPPGKHAFVFIFITVLIDMIGFGIIIPVMPQLIMELTGQPIESAAVMGGLLMGVFAFTQFIFAPIIGGLSDRYGRRRILLFAMAGFTIDYLIMGTATTFAVLFLGRMMSGVFGATYTTANAYIADITDAKDRAGRFGMMGAAFGLGFILGPVVGGLLGEIDPRYPFFAAAALAGINVIYGYFILPETLSPENRRPFNIRRANPFGSLLQMRQYPVVFAMLTAAFLFFLGHAAFPALWTYFSTLRFDWTPRDIGLSLMAVGLASAIVQGGLTRIIVARIGEWRAYGIGFSIAALAYVGYGFVSEVWIFYVIMAFGSFAGIGGPAMQSICTRLVPANSQGELQGAMSSLQSLSMVIGPLTLPLVFRYFTTDSAPVYLPGAAFLLAAILTVLALIVGLSSRSQDVTTLTKPVPAEAE